MRIFLLGLLLLLSHMIQANPALNQFNTLLQEKSKSIEANKGLQALKKDYELIFIFQSNCPHCHRFAPLLKDFANHHEIPVKAYSMDGGRLADFTSEKLSPNYFKLFFLNAGFKPMVPALFLLNTQIDEAYPVLFGEASAMQLAERMNSLIKRIGEKFDG